MLTASKNGNVPNRTVLTASKNGNVLMSRKSIKEVLLTVTGLIAVFVCMAAGIYYSWFPDIGTLRPLSAEPDSLQGLTAQQLVDRLRPPQGWYYQIEDHQLIAKPIKPPVPDTVVVNPTVERRLLLAFADPYVFASPHGKTDWYTLTVFCYQNQNCGHVKTFTSGNVLEPRFLLSAATKKEKEAQYQLEIVRKLILLAGGKSSVDRKKILARLEYDISQLSNSD